MIQPTSLLLPILALLFATILPVAANTEKAVFTAPDTVNIPLMKPSLDDLNLHTLTPDTWSIRANLTRIFPVEPGNAATGAATWLLLDRLVPGQRYEFRVCWAAIQPTSFSLSVHELAAVWDTPELIQSLAEYSSARQRSSEGGEEQQLHDHQSDQGERQSSVLLLQIRASADYFTDDVALMKNPPPVLADLILDPYLYNVVPRSLVPTVAYLTIVGFIAWLVARPIASKLQSIAITTETATKKQN
ncbi:hypothetical protein AK830_g11341 [Neonectria ditissima]|uniref:Uncharacterized protein n=1 Tax=Neonectria ditissima TaxID=78410 RepID=A0A0P7AMS0_9HYPO|nr:hypothetical protein AK830_g11341 [Neonectria ditissima]